MTTFTVNAADGREMVWADGVLSGDPRLCGQLAAKALSLEGREVGFPTGPSTTTKHLADPLSALRLMLELAGADAVASGDVPHLAPVPPGAVA